MGYVFLMFNCIACRRPETGNPDRVPSVRCRRGEDGGLVLDEAAPREPLCRICADLINANRKEQGLEPFPIPPDAYEAAEE